MSRSIDHRIAHSKAVRGRDRQDYFARAGATAHDWRGGASKVTKDRKKEASKMACRKDEHIYST